MKRFSIALLLLFYVSCDNSPDDVIVSYAKNKLGSDFKDGVIDLSDIFNFNWKELYVFSPLTYPEDVTKQIGFNYDGQMVKDDHYLFLFINDLKIAKQFTASDLKLGFSDDDHTGIYKISRSDSKFRIKLLGSDNYWLYRLE